MWPTPSILARAAMQKFAPETKKPVPAEIDLGAYRIADPEEFGRNMLQLHGRGPEGHERPARARRRQDRPLQRRQRDDAMPAKLFAEIAQPWMAEPGQAGRGARRPVRATTCNSSRNTAQRAMGGEALPVAEPEAGDNRFNDPEWSRNPYFDFWKQSYLITTRWLEDAARQDRRARRAHAPARRVLSEADGRARCRPPTSR